MVALDIQAIDFPRFSVAFSNSGAVFIPHGMCSTAYSHIAKTPKAPHIVNPDIPRSVSAIIMKLMAKDLEQCYQSAAGIVHDFRKCLESLLELGFVGDF